MQSFRDIEIPTTSVIFLRVANNHSARHMRIANLAKPYHEGSERSYPMGGSISVGHTFYFWGPSTCYDSSDRLCLRFWRVGGIVPHNDSVRPVRRTCGASNMREPSATRRFALAAYYIIESCKDCTDSLCSQRCPLHNDKLVSRDLPLPMFSPQPESWNEFSDIFVLPLL